MKQNYFDNNINNLKIMTKKEHQKLHNCYFNLKGGGFK
jgi:hypothetical protein